jgi:Na+-translocating ferredoxin:NAD+ oxidoreductase RnfC subunit
MNTTSEQIIQAGMQAGVTGTWGSGLPFHVSLNSRVETVIANGGESEPLLVSDKTLLTEKAYRVVTGLRHAMTASGAKSGVVAIRESREDAVNSVEKYLPEDGSIRVHKLKDYYPAGDECLAVFEITGKVIPEGSFPASVGIMVSNVLALAQLADAVEGKPVTERPVTIAGSVNKPQVATVPIGTTYNDLIQMAGGALNASDVLIDGGPMMGTIVSDRHQGISKSTTGVIALPQDHFVIRMRTTSASQMVKKSKAACNQCGQCTDLCPRRLLGHGIAPHEVMRTIDYNLSEPAAVITSSFLCSDCGLCELMACDTMELSPRAIYKEYRKLLIQKGIQNPHKNSQIAPLKELQFRKVPIHTMIQRLELSPYISGIPSTGFWKPHRVRIPLDSHQGIPAAPVVGPGDRVTKNDVIAVSPFVNESDEAGTVCHASIGGIVKDVTGKWIEIHSGREQ